MQLYTIVYVKVPMGLYTVSHEKNASYVTIYRDVCNKYGYKPQHMKKRWKSAIVLHLHLDIRIDLLRIA